MYFESLDVQTLAQLRYQAREVAEEFSAKAKLNSGQTVVVGCSTSKILGHQFGSFSHPDAGEAVFEGLYSIFSEKGIFLAAQCCEHLNRALVLEEEALKPNYEIVNVLPQPKAGGSFATAAFHHFKKPVVVEAIQADAGLDIGGTMVGMHLKRVAVPMNLENAEIGQAIVLCARTRPKYIGGSRAVYAE